MAYAILYARKVSLNALAVSPFEEKVLNGATGIKQFKNSHIVIKIDNIENNLQICKNFASDFILLFPKKKSL